MHNKRGEILFFYVIIYIQGDYMKKLKVGMFMDSWYPDINGVILVMENLMKNMSKYADITLVVPKTGSEENDKNYPFKVIRVDSIPVFNTSYKLGMVDLEYFKYKKIFEKLDFHLQIYCA